MARREAPSSVVDSTHRLTLMHPAIGAWPIDVMRAGKRPSPPIRLAQVRFMAARRRLRVSPIPRLRTDARNPMHATVAAPAMEQEPT